MYPVKLGYGEAKIRINQLLQNGHSAEALLTSVFTFEKVIHRTLKQLIVSAGFRSKDAEAILGRAQGFRAQADLWPCFDPDHAKLPEIIGNAHWQHLAKVVKMRNNLVHGSKVYKLSECKAEAVKMLSLLDQTVDSFNSKYSYDGWSRVAVRKKSVLHIDPKVGSSCNKAKQLGTH